MQVIDIDDVHGVRAAVTTFASEDSSLSFVVVPVAQVAEVAHYEAVRAAARSCDVLVVPSSDENGQGAAYDPRESLERFAGGRDVRLAVAPADLWAGIDRPFAPRRAASGPPRPTGRSRTDAVRSRLAPVLPMVAGLAARYTNRVVIAALMASEVADGESSLAPGLPAALDWHGEHHGRAAREAVAEAVRTLHDERGDQPVRAAIAHWTYVVPAAAPVLEGLGYAPVDTEWIPVFAWLPHHPAGGPLPR